MHMQIPPGVEDLILPDDPEIGHMTAGIFEKPAYGWKITMRETFQPNSQRMYWLPCWDMYRGIVRSFIENNFIFQHTGVLCIQKNDPYVIFPGSMQRACDRYRIISSGTFTDQDAWTIVTAREDVIHPLSYQLIQIFFRLCAMHHLRIRQSVDAVPITQPVCECHVLGEGGCMAIAPHRDENGLCSDMLTKYDQTMLSGRCGTIMTGP